MNRAMRHRFGVLAALLVFIVLAGLISVPLLQRCCPDPPLLLGWTSLPNPSLLDRLFNMDMLPRLAALAVGAGAVSLAAVSALYVVTAKTAAWENDRGPLGYLAGLRVVAASVVVGIFYLYGLFLTGYFQLGWFNLVWIVGVPVLVAAIIGRDEAERRWGGLLLIIPGFFMALILLLAFGISLY